MYYMQDTRQFVGNSMLWWRKGGGYTCDLKQAEMFLEGDAEKIHKNRDSDKPWQVKYINSLIQHHVDIQTVKAQPKD